MRQTELRPGTRHLRPPPSVRRPRLVHRPEIQTRHEDSNGKKLADGEKSDKRLKGSHSKRRIPIHPEILRLGFLDYLAERRGDDSHPRLFPTAARGADGYYSSPFSKWFGRFRTLTLGAECKATFHSFRHHFREALDEPGEWFLDRNGTLSYLPLPGEDMTKAEVFAPLVEQFVLLKGAPEKSRFVEDVSFKGLAFRYGQYVLPPGGHGDGQAEVSIPAVFEADGARRVAIEDCEFGHVGIYGVWFRRGCRDYRVSLPRSP